MVQWLGLCASTVGDLGLIAGQGMQIIPLLMAESKAELKNLLTVKEESEKSWLETQH